MSEKNNKNNIKGKYIIIDLKTMEYMKTENNEIIYYNTEEEAINTCGMYEFENVWICKLVFNHIEAENKR